MVLQEGKPLVVSFGQAFVATDQDVADLAAPKPETNWCLVELPKEHLEALEAGKPFCFQELGESGAGRGEGSGGAMLCTHNATFELEFLENSNSLFIAAVQAPSREGDPQKPDVTPAEQATPAAFACTVFAQARGHLIVKPTVGDEQRVREILAPHSLGQAPALGDGGEPLAGVTREALEYEVAISPAELQALLEEGPYVEHGGSWRLLPAALERDILDAVASVITAMGWQPEAVEAVALLREVQQHFGDAAGACVPSLAVLLKALRSVVLQPAGAGTAAAQPDTASVDGGATVAPTGSAPPATGTISFDKEKLNRFRALQLLREPPSQVRARFQLPPPPRPKRARLGGGAGAGRDGLPLQQEEFYAAFRELAGAEPSAEEILKLLGNGAYVDDLEGTIHAIDATTLPQEPMERLKRLFELQAHWRPERLAALIAPVLSKGQKVETWLMKWTRSVYVEIAEGSEQRLLQKKFFGK